MGEGTSKDRMMNDEATPALSEGRKDGAIDKGKKKLPSKPSAEEGSVSWIAKTKLFLEEVRGEFDKIVWPDKKHTMGTTVVVVVLVFIISFYLGAVDLVLGKLVEFVLK